jgi:starch phosphorylase
VTEQLVNGFFPDTEDEFTAIYDSLLDHNDQYFVLRDFASYVDIQERIGNEYRLKDAWLDKSLINIAKSGFFSSDRTIREYADEIWKIAPSSKK